MIAIFQQGSCRVWLRIGKKGEHEYFRIPKVAALIAPMGQPSGAYAGIRVAVRHRLHELENVIADGTLPLIVAGDLDIRGFPKLCPCFGGFLKKPVKGCRAKCFGLFPDKLLRVAVPEGGYGDALIADIFFNNANNYFNNKFERLSFFCSLEITLCSLFNFVNSFNNIILNTLTKSKDW